MRWHKGNCVREVVATCGESACCNASACFFRCCKASLAGDAERQRRRQQQRQQQQQQRQLECMSRATYGTLAQAQLTVAAH
jgi:hypothetical protein